MLTIILTDAYGLLTYSECQVYAFLYLSPYPTPRKITYAIWSNLWNVGLMEMMQPYKKETLESASFHIQWELVGTDVCRVDANWKLRFLLLHPTICSFDLCCSSTTNSHLESFSSFKLKIKNSPSELIFLSRAIAGLSSLKSTLLGGRRNLQGYTKVRLRNTHMGIQAHEHGFSSIGLFLCFLYGRTVTCLV